MEALLLPVGLLVVLYFLMIRPQQKRMRAREAMVRSVSVGDEVATVGGVIGTVVAEYQDDVKGDILVIEVDEDPQKDIEMRVQRRAIAEVFRPATAPEEETVHPETDSLGTGSSEIDTEQ